MTQTKEYLLFVTQTCDAKCHKSTVQRRKAKSASEQQNGENIRKNLFSHLQQGCGMKLVLDLVLVSSRLDIRRVDSLNVFKNSMVNYLNLPHYNPLKLNCCALNYYLFRINCVPYPGCICGFQDETINHYFLYCLRFAALRQILLPSVAHAVL